MFRKLAHVVMVHVRSADHLASPLCGPDKWLPDVPGGVPLQSRRSKQRRWNALLAALPFLSVQACSEVPLSPASTPSDGQGVHLFSLGYSQLSIDSIQTFSNAGVRTQTVRPGDPAKAGNPPPFTVRPSREEIPALIEALEALAHQIGEKSGGTTMMASAAKAIAAPAAHTRPWGIAEMPVSFSSTFVQGGDGRPGVRQDHRVNGAVKVSRFGHFGPLNSRLSLPQPVGSLERGASFQVTQSSEYCETEFEGVQHRRVRDRG